MPIGYCAFTGVPIDTIAVDPELSEIFDALVHTAAAYKQYTGRYLDIFGEHGELYAEIELGIKRNKPNAPGSDGRLGDDFIEVKTISPLKQDDKVRVKRKGNFNKLYVVKISENFFFEGRMIDRRELKQSDGKFASVRFDKLESDEQ